MQWQDFLEKTIPGASNLLELQDQNPDSNTRVVAKLAGMPVKDLEAIDEKLWLLDHTADHLRRIVRERDLGPQVATELVQCVIEFADRA